MMTDRYTEENDICTICLEPWMSNNPRILQCRHVFCFGCIQQYYEANDSGLILSCPNCREEFDIDEMDNLSHYRERGPLREMLNQSVGQNLALSSAIQQRKNVTNVDDDTDDDTDIDMIYFYDPGEQRILLQMLESMFNEETDKGKLQLFKDMKENFEKVKIELKENCEKLKSRIKKICTIL